MSSAADIRDIKGLVALPGWPWWAWLLLAAILAAAAALVYRWARRSSAAENTVPSPPPLPPAEMARRALAALLEEGLIARGEVDRFYTRLSQIVRQYLENQFKLHAPERTTEEFLLEIRDEPRLGASQRSRLGDFLRESDLVKFARQPAAAEDMQRAHATARRLVEETAA